MQTIKNKARATKHQPEQELATMMHKVSDLIAVYWQQVMIGLAAIAVVAVIAAGYGYMRSQQEQQAAPFVAVAYELYNPAGVADADYARALGLFRDIQKKYPGTKSGAIAQYYVGNCLVNLGRPDEALKEYANFTANYDGEKLLLGLVYQRMGYVYSMLGKQAEAIKAFERAEAIAGPGVPTIELARLLEISGNMPESQKKYKQAMERLGGTTWGMEAMERVQKIAPLAAPAQPKAGK